MYAHQTWMLLYYCCWFSAVGWSVCLFEVDDSLLLIADHVGAFVGRMLGNIWAMLGLLGGIFATAAELSHFGCAFWYHSDDVLKGWNGCRTWGERGAKLWHVFCELGINLGPCWVYVGTMQADGGPCGHLCWANVGRVDTRSLFKCHGVVMMTVRGLKCTRNWGWTSVCETCGLFWRSW